MLIVCFEASKDEPRSGTAQQQQQHKWNLRRGEEKFSQYREKYRMSIIKQWLNIWNIKYRREAKRNIRSSNNNKNKTRQRGRQGERRAKRQDERKRKQRYSLLLFLHWKKSKFLAAFSYATLFMVIGSAKERKSVEESTFVLSHCVVFSLRSKSLAFRAAAANATNTVNMSGSIWILHKHNIIRAKWNSFRVPRHSINNSPLS